MTTLPIKRMILYKHGVGYFERRADVEGETVEISFRTSDMNDILKSLTVIDRGQGQVLGLQYPTPRENEKNLQGCSIKIDSSSSIQDLLTALVGRRVRLLVGEPGRVSNFSSTSQSLVGTLIGIDKSPKEHTVGETLISILRDNTSQVYVIALERLSGLDILDTRGADDLKFFLQATANIEELCPVQIRLSPGTHDLSITYVAPAPAWRVSYRLVIDTEEKTSHTNIMLLGLGIFDNTLDEDLENLSLSFVAGMPISFIYDIFSPFTPERPLIQEEERSMEFRSTVDKGFELPDNTLTDQTPSLIHELAHPIPQDLSAETLRSSIQAESQGRSLGELLEYHIQTPVSVGRGQSAVVPILSANLPYRKELVYSSSKCLGHPITEMRITNKSGFTLERGPVTVFENGKYIGEGILPFSQKDSEVPVAYSIEMGVDISSSENRAREIHGLGIKDMYMVVIEWDTIQTQYIISNHTPQNIHIIIEHPISPGYDLFDSPKPKESVLDAYKFEIVIPSHAKQNLKIQERTIHSRHENLRDISLQSLQDYLEKNHLDRRTYVLLTEILNLWNEIGKKEQRIVTISKERINAFENQKRLRENIQPLEPTGKEGELRDSYVDRLQKTEEEITQLNAEEQRLYLEAESLEQEIKESMQRLQNPPGPAQ